MRFRKRNFHSFIRIEIQAKTKQCVKLVNRRFHRFVRPIRFAKRFYACIRRIVLAACIRAAFTKRYALLRCVVYHCIYAVIDTERICNAVRAALTSGIVIVAAVTADCKELRMPRCKRRRIYEYVAQGRTAYATGVIRAENRRAYVEALRRR